MSQFLESQPKSETNWRAIILFGRNVATYKFALGRSLLVLASQDKTFVTLEELTVPFSKHILEHLKLNNKQGTEVAGASLIWSLSYQYYKGCTSGMNT